MPGRSPDRQTFVSILLSHHASDRLHLCYRLAVGKRGVYLCARCLGLFPAMFAVLLVGNLTGRWSQWIEWVLLFLAPLPALLDWATTTATGSPERRNWIRLVTGVGLGIGLGASLHVNTYALLSYPVMAQFVFFLAAVWIVWMISYARRSRIRKASRLARLNARPALQEYVLGSDANSRSESDDQDNTSQTR